MVVFGHRIGEAIAHVESRGMAASFAIPRERGERCFSFFRGYRDYLYTRFFEELANSSFDNLNARTVLATHSKCGFEKSYR